MHRAQGSAIWMERPLSARLLQYAANDIYLIALLYEHFVACRWINKRDPLGLLAQSRRYVSTQLEQGRTHDKDYFRMGALLPLDVLTKPRGIRERCSGCRRLLSLPCFDVTGTSRNSRCRVCYIIAIKRHLPLDDR